MTGAQFLEWRAYAELEPFDEVRADLRIAHLVQTVRAFAGVKSTLAECLLPFGEDEQPEPTPKTKDWREIKAAGDAWAAALNAKNHPHQEPPAPPVPPRRRRPT